jgi:maleamate amidohydrolase
VHHPFCRALAGPHTGPKKRIVAAEIDLDDIRLAKVSVCGVGHYAPQRDPVARRRRPAEAARPVAEPGRNRLPMSRPPPFPPHVTDVLRSTTVESFLDFYRRRGYAHDVGRGTRPALIVIDFSVGFTRGTERYPSPGYPAEVAEAARLLDAARGRAPIVFTTIAYRPDMADAGLWAKKIPWIEGLQEGTEEVAIDERLAPRPDETVLVKKYPSAFFGTDLDARLKAEGIDTLIICGCTTSVCVRATTIDAMALGYRPLLPAEAIAEMDPNLHAIHLMELNARYADVISVDEAIAYLAELAPGTR